MVDEMDAGPVYAKRPLALNGRAEEIYLRAGHQSVEMIEWIVREDPTPLPQHGEVVLFQRRKPAQSQLPMEWNLAMLYDHIRMLDAPTYPHAYIDHGNVRIEFKDAAILEGDELHATVVLRKRTSGQNL
jgi:methionyl-tRNA formyltransferase